MNCCKLHPTHSKCWPRLTCKLHKTSLLTCGIFKLWGRKVAAGWCFGCDSVSNYLSHLHYQAFRVQSTVQTHKQAFPTGTVLSGLCTGWVNVKGNLISAITHCLCTSARRSAYLSTCLLKEGGMCHLGTERETNKVGDGRQTDPKLSA